MLATRLMLLLIETQDLEYDFNRKHWLRIVDVRWKNIIHLKNTAWKSWDIEKLIGNISEDII